VLRPGQSADGADHAVRIALAAFTDWATRANIIASAIFTRFNSVLSMIDAGVHHAREREPVASLRSAIGIDQTPLAARATRAQPTAAIGVGFETILLVVGALTRDARV
jgi:hypothetical protein